MIIKNITSLKQWFLRCRVPRNHVITDNFVIPNCLCNVPVEDVSCLTCLLQNVAKIVQEGIANKSKLAKVLLHLGTGSHCDRWIKLFSGLRRCYGGQWPLTDRYFKCCNKKLFKRLFCRILQIRGDISANFLKIRKVKFSNFLLLPLSGITKISDRKYETVKVAIYHEGMCNWINCF